MNVHLCVCSTQQVMVAWKGTFNFRFLESMLLDILFIGTDYFTCGDKFNNKPIQSFICWMFCEMLNFSTECQWNQPFYYLISCKRLFALWLADLQCNYSSVQKFLIFIYFGRKIGTRDWNILRRLQMYTEQQHIRQKIEFVLFKQTWKSTFGVTTCIS